MCFLFFYKFLIPHTGHFHCIINLAFFVLNNLGLNFQYFFCTLRNTSSCCFITSVCKALNYFLLLYFCFEHLDLLDQQVMQLDFFLSTLFVISTSCSLNLCVNSLHPKQYVVPSSFPVFVDFIFDYVFFMSYIVGGIFLMKYLTCFNGLEMLHI